MGTAQSNPVAAAADVARADQASASAQTPESEPTASAPGSDASSPAPHTEPAITPAAATGQDLFSVQTGYQDLLRCGSGNSGLASVRATAARISGVDHSLGEAAQTVLCLDVCGAEASIAAEDRDPMDVALVIDTSGSMCNVIQEVKETCLQVFTALRCNDRISLVSFSTRAEVMLPMSVKSSVDGFIEICQGITAGGGTNMEDGLRTGIGQLNQADVSRSTSLAIVLSDGSPNGGERNKDVLCSIAAAAALQSGRSVTIHALGFTQHHQVDLMSQLPQSSNGPPGSYYYLGTQSDMPAAVGDCLGAGNVARPCRNLRVSLEALADSKAEALGVCSWYGSAMTGEGALLALQTPEDFSISALQASERQVAIFVLPPNAFGAALCLTWESDAGHEKLEVRLDWSANSIAHDSISLPDIVPSSLDLERLSVTSHVLRLQVAAALATLAVSPIGERYDALHGALLQCLAVLQTVSAEANDEIEEEVVFLEGMLQALERDLGEALTSRDQGSERQGVLLSFSAEHFAMRSASSLTRVRTAYATRQQIQMRLRFLLSSAGEGSVAAKEACAVDEEGLTEQERTCRKSLEQHNCYVTLASWRECVLGLGLFVHPRTCRERRGGVPPQVDLVVDYVSAEAYNLGVRTTVQHAAVEGSDSDDEAQAPKEVLQSSTRRRINAWLPLHINTAHWAIAKTFAPSAFSLIATQLNAVFRPEDALKVCARLLCCAVVGFVRSDEERERTCASERAVQMYCDVHRLFLKMAADYPVIRKMALEHVQGFIHNPDVRTRKATPDLGLLITYLSILDEVTWPDLCEVFVPEMVRRAFGRMKEPSGVERCDTENDIIARFDLLEPEHGRVILFFKVFNSLVARPAVSWDASPSSKTLEGNGKALPLAAVCEMYDRRWGQLPSEQCEAVLQEIKRMRVGCGGVASVLRELLPFSFSDEDVCELILWAGKYGESKKAITQSLPLQCMHRTLTDEWRRGRKIRAEFAVEARQVLSHGGTAAEQLNELLSVTNLFWQRITSVTATPVPKHRYASAKEACVAAASARERAAERLASKGKGKGKCKSEVCGKGNGSCDSDSDVDSSRGEAQVTSGAAQEELITSGRGSFVLKVLVSADICGSSDQSVLLAMCYKDDEGVITTGRKLRALIAAETGLDARKMRLVARGVRQVAAAGNSTEPRDTPLSNSAVLATWELEAPGAVIEVQKKQRGGKKPGNGWHAQRSHGRTYQMCIAGAIVRDTVFSKVDQYFTVVNHFTCLDTMLGLCKTLKKDAAVICGGGLKSLEIFQHEAVGRGLGAELCMLDGTLRLNLGSQKLLVLAETDALESEPLTIYVKEGGAEAGGAEADCTQDIRPATPKIFRAARNIYPPTEQEHHVGGIAFDGGKGEGKGGKGGNSSQLDAQVKDELPVPATIAVPPEAAEAGLIIVIGGHFLRETASLSKVICGVCGMGRGGVPMPMFHLVTDTRQVMLESQDQLQAVAVALGTDGRVKNTVELPSQACVPSGALLLPAEASQGSAPTLPDATQLPAVVGFKLRMPSLGLITRLRDRYCCTISEIYYDVVSSLLERGSQEQ